MILVWRDFNLSKADDYLLNVFGKYAYQGYNYTEFYSEERLVGWKVERVAHGHRLSSNGNVSGIRVHPQRRRDVYNNAPKS